MPDVTWRGPYIAGMSACGRCGAMVVFDGRQLHEEWHAVERRLIDSVLKKGASKSGR